ncbi:MAG: TonB-dependent receptor domain-containing protein, partial [bacterium]
GELVTGKAAARFQPSREVTIRAAASTGFRAPGLAQSHFSKVVTNVIGGVFEEVGIFPVGDRPAQVLGAKALDEETAVNLSAGIAFTPVENLTLTVDYFHIKIEDRILLGATFDDAATQAIFADSGITGVTGVQYSTNGLDTRTQGADITASLRVPVGPAGTLDLAAALNYTKNEITRVDPLPQVLQAYGSTEPGIIDSVTWIAIEDERPERRATLTAQYSTGRFRLLLRGSNFGRFSSAQPGFCDQCRERYGAKTLYDAEVGYRVGQVNASLGIRNLFDTFPDQPKDDFNNNFGTFPWAAASPFGYNGRYVYARVEMRLQ